MNWYGELDYFYPLDAETEALFATPRETVLAIQSFNRILYAIMDGDDSSVLEPLALICKDYPIFGAARHLYGILLAGRGDYEQALKILKQTALLDLEPQNLARLELQIKELETEVRKSRLRKEKQKRREDMLLEVKADLAKTSILQRAGEIPEEQSYASSEEQRQLAGPKRLGTVIGLYAEDEAQEKRKTVRFAVALAVISVLILTIFFAFIRPALLKKSEAEASRRLGWLETELKARESESAIADLLSDYERFLKGETETSSQETQSETMETEAGE